MKKYLKYIIIIFTLIVIDQGSKLIVADVFEGEVVLASNQEDNTDNMEVYNAFHIHPIINDTDNQVLLQKSLDSSSDFGFLVFVDIALNLIFAIVIFILLYTFSRFLPHYKIKRHPKILSSILCLFIAAGICSLIIDRIFWGGSLDFICLSLKETHLIDGCYHAFVHHYIFDFKDIYLWIGFALFMIYAILFVINCCRLSKEERKELDRKLKNSIMNIFRSKKNKQVI